MWKTGYCVTIRIDELICNVTVTLGTSPLQLMKLSAATKSSSSDEGDGPAPLERVLPHMLAANDGRSPSAGAVADRTEGSGAGSASQQNVDPRELAERVYRLMCDELATAQERE